MRLPYPSGPCGRKMCQAAVEKRTFNVLLRDEWGFIGKRDRLPNEARAEPP